MRGRRAKRCQKRKALLNAFEFAPHRAAHRLFKPVADFAGGGIFRAFCPFVFGRRIDRADETFARSICELTSSCSILENTDFAVQAPHAVDFFKHQCPTDD